MDPEQAEDAQFQVQSKKKTKQADPKKSVRFPAKQLRSLTDAVLNDKLLNSVKLSKVNEEFGEALVRESLVPAFLTLVARVEREWLVIKEERKEERDSEQQAAKYKRLSKGLIRAGLDKLKLPTTAKNVQPKEIKLAKNEQIGSYSFSVRDKTIYVPGFPSVYQTPKFPHVAPESTATVATFDKSDPHRATFDYSFDPLLVACHELKGDFNIDDYDVVTGRNNLCKLFGWLLGAKEAWRIDAEVLGNKKKTLFLARRDLPVVMSDSDAAAIEFERICGQNDDESTFQVLTHMELHGGVPGAAPIKILMICEVDAALPAGTDVTKFTRKPPAPVLPANAPAIASADPAIVSISAPKTVPASTEQTEHTPAVAATAAVPAAQPQPAQGPVLDIEERKKQKAEAVELSPLHEKAEARVKRTTQPKTVAMVELKSIFEANWTKENNDKLVKHWFQCWLANVQLLVCGIKLSSNADNKISLIEAHAFRPGPIQRNPNLPPELAGFEYDDFFFNKAVWPGVETKGLGWKEIRDRLARARLETLHRMYILIGDIRRKVEMAGGKTKRISLLGNPDHGDADVYLPPNVNEKWAIPPWYIQYYSAKQQQQQSSPVSAPAAADSAASSSSPTSS